MQPFRGVRTIEEVRALLAGQGCIVATWDVGGRRVHWVRMTPYRISRARVSQIEVWALQKLARHPELQSLMVDG